MSDTPDLVRIFVTIDPLAHGRIEEVYAKIDGDTAHFALLDYRYCITGEGSVWHRTRWAAEHYARQLQIQRVGALREELSRVEGLQFGRPGT